MKLITIFICIFFYFCEKPSDSGTWNVTCCTTGFELHSPFIINYLLFESGSRQCSVNQQMFPINQLPAESGGNPAIWKGFSRRGSQNTDLEMDAKPCKNKCFP